jgi:DNA-binding transcriptional ArsR family regulator
VLDRRPADPELRTFPGQIGEQTVIHFRLSLDVLGNTRFAFSPLCEVGSSLRILADPGATRLHAPWVRRVIPRMNEVDRDLLLGIARPGRWAAGWLFPRPSGPESTIESQLETLAATPHESLVEDLGKVWEGQPLPRRVQELFATGDQASGLLAEAIQQYWTVAIAPYWTRMRGVLEDDVAFRAGLTMTGGLFDLLSDLHPEISLRADEHVLTIDKPQHADATYDGAVLTLVPSIFVWPRLIVGHSRPGAFELTYAVRGIARVWESGHEVTRPADRLGALLGRTRAAILTLVEVPMSTTQIARTLSQSPGSVSQHLSVLRDSGMVTSRRRGRSVLYQQTALATSLVAANRAAERPRAVG